MFNLKLIHKTCCAISCIYAAFISLIINTIHVALVMQIIKNQSVINEAYLFHRIYIKLELKRMTTKICYNMLMSDINFNKQKLADK